MNFQTRIKRKILFNRDIFGLEVFLPRIRPVPGQFFQLQANPGIDPFLQRPISIASHKNRHALFIIKIVGKGTKILSEKRPGDPIFLRGPMGKGIRPKKGKTLLIAGGIGIAPLYFLAQHCRKRKIPFSIIYGAKTEKDLILKTALKKLTSSCFFVVEKGKGEKGTVISFLKNFPVKNYKFIYVCGPRPMLIQLQKLKITRPVYAFCEDFLGCGCGICLGCAIMVKNTYKRVCTDGPVFKLKEINFLNYD